MNYRKVKLIVVCNKFTVYNVTAITANNNNIELFPYSRNTINSLYEKSFENSHDFYNWINKLCSANMLKPRLISKDFGSNLYDINVIDISRQPDISVTRHYYNY